MTSYLHLNRIFTLLALALLGASLGMPGGARADEATTSDPEISFGIQGHYRVGCWTGVKINGQSFSEIETRDGDGVQVNFTQETTITPNAWGYALPGSEAAPAILRLQDDVVVSTRFPTEGSVARGPAMIPLKMPWIIAIGDSLGVDEIGANKILGRDARIAVSKPQSANDFPDSVLGYDGVNMLLVGASSIDILRTLNEQQQKAISDWILNGGHIFVTLGKSSIQLLDAAPWLKELLPFEKFQTTKINPSSLETFTSTQTPLKEFEGLKLPRDRGHIIIMGRTNRRVSTPIAAEYIVGFGQVTTIAADLDSDMFATWPERLDLITQLTGTILVAESERKQEASRATAYGDLAGQMRTTLDQFSIRRHFDFSIVSLILMTLIALIGPLDYLLINRVFGRPLLGWLTFPIAAIALSVLLAMQTRLEANPTQSESKADMTSAATTAPAIEGLQCNRIEIFDVDSIQNIGRGFAVSYLYSHHANSYSVNVSPTASLTSLSNQMERTITTPFGYPGESFGGIQIAVEDSRLPRYDVMFSQDSSDSIQTNMMRLPLASRSSKGFATSCWFQPNLSKQATIRRRPGSDLLRGELTNPLSTDLLEGMLIYRNWAYVLPTRFRAKSTVASLDSLRQKNFRWQLSRQKALESSTETEAWDPSQDDSPERIAEMLMFHDTVGGSRYTTLRDDPLAFLDLSHALSEDRCLLLGKLASPLTNVEVHDDNASMSPEGETLTFIRVLLPVENVSR